jgi:hypothetical protein
MSVDTAMIEAGPGDAEAQGWLGKADSAPANVSGHQEAGSRADRRPEPCGLGV